MPKSELRMQSYGAANRSIWTENFKDLEKKKPDLGFFGGTRTEDRRGRIWRRGSWGRAPATGSGEGGDSRRRGRRGVGGGHIRVVSLLAYPCEFYAAGIPEGCPLRPKPHSPQPKAQRAAQLWLLYGGVHSDSSLCGLCSRFALSRSGWAARPVK